MQCVNIIFHLVLLVFHLTGAPVNEKGTKYNSTTVNSTARNKSYIAHININQKRLALFRRESFDC